MGVPSRAHRGDETRTYTRRDASFEHFCDRQRSRVANTARAIQRRYVSRILTVVVDATPEVTIKGYGIGGGPRQTSDE